MRNGAQTSKSVSNVAHRDHRQINEELLHRMFSWLNVSALIYTTELAILVHIWTEKRKHKLDS